MADSVISQLPPALSITAADFIPIDQGGVTKRATLGMLGNGTVFVVAGKIFTVNNTLTLTGTDGTTMTFPSTNASLARTDAAQSFTGLQTFINGITTPAQVTSTVATGTPPLVVASTTPVTNLSIGGNAATVTTNANLTGMVTSVGNATTVVTNANLTGEITSVGNATTVTNAAVIGKVLTGFVSGAGTVAATDTILQAVDKLDGNVAARALLAGSASQTFSVAPATAATQAIAGSQLFGFRNKLINGDMAISQRGTSFSSPAIGTYTLDRWLVNYDGTSGTFTISQNTSGATAERFFELYWNQTVAASGSTIRGIEQRIEDITTTRDWIFVTISFIGSSVTGGVQITPVITQNFGGGGSASVFIGGTPIALSASRVRYTQTIAISSIVGKTLGTNSYFALDLQFNNVASSIFGVTITQVQLEVGSLATPFEQRPYQYELALSKRYYRRWQNTSLIVSPGASNFEFIYVDVSDMRIAATVTTNITDGTYNAALPANTWAIALAGVANVTKTGVVGISIASYPGISGVRLDTATWSSVPNLAQFAGDRYIDATAEL